MCFTTQRNQFKIAEKPIRVYKVLIGRSSSIQYYIYCKGLNVPESTIVESVQTRSVYNYFGGVLHCFKNKCKKMVTMYVPVGAEYNDEGCGISSNEVISTALYWPKNIFEQIWYYLHSKKY